MKLTLSICAALVGGLLAGPAVAAYDHGEWGDILRQTAEKQAARHRQEKQQAQLRKAKEQQPAKSYQHLEWGTLQGSTGQARKQAAPKRAPKVTFGGRVSAQDHAEWGVLAGSTGQARR